MDHSKKSTYLYSIDALRVIAIIGVIIIHTTTKTLQHIDHNIIEAPLNLFLNQAARFAVPLFFLISGFVLELNHKEITYFTFLKRRASRILIPYFFWSTVYFLIGWNYDITKLFSLRFLQDLLFGTASYHLYFIPTLILFYLIYPIIHNFLVFISRSYIILLLLIFQLLITIKDFYFGQIQFQYSLRIALLNIVIFIIGMISSRYHKVLMLYVKNNLKLIFMTMVAILTFIYFHVYQLTLTNQTSGYIYNQYGPINYVYTISLTALLFYIFEKSQFLKRQLITLSRLSFYVFFVHVIVLNTFWNTLITPAIKEYGTNFLMKFWFDPLLLSVVTFLSFILAYVSHKFLKSFKITG